MNRTWDIGHDDHGMNRTWDMGHDDHGMNRTWDMGHDDPDIDMAAVLMEGAQATYS